MVVPAGTFRVQGDVTEGGTGVSGARVEVVSGPDAGLVATTGWDGSYALWGVAGNLQIRASKDGYAHEDRRVLITDHQTVNFGLKLSDRRPALGGEYTLTIRASCEAPFPPEFRTRRFHASVVQNGSALEVRLSGASFEPGSFCCDFFTGRTEPNGAGFTLDPYGDGSFSIVEKVSSGRSVYVGGQARTTLTAAGLDGTLDGTVSVFGPSGPPGGQGVCRSASHGFTFTR
jgi:hypothetical protein